MRNQFFRFKQFNIDQGDCAMKVGTDGVLLGSWCDVCKATNVLDIGTGTGLIALMIAQRSPEAIIKAVEIDEKAFAQALLNFSNSSWSERITGYNIDFIEFAKECDLTFDLIVSNPPYFENSLKSSNLGRNMARHTDMLSFEDLIGCSSGLLSQEGILSLIVPSSAEDRLDAIAISNNLKCRRKTYIKGNADVAVKRLMVEYQKNQSMPEIKTEYMIIEKDRNVYTEQYIALTKDFYLKM